MTEYKSSTIIFLSSPNYNKWLIFQIIMIECKLKTILIEILLTKENELKIG